MCGVPWLGKAWTLYEWKGRRRDVLIYQLYCKGGGLMDMHTRTGSAVLHSVI